ncbi:MAG: hypothetical protein ACC683_12210 [Acidimicrobiia bacterium]
MAKYEEIALGVFLADPVAVFDRVEKERATLSVMRGRDPVAVISPAPVAETLADIHRALQQEPPDSAFFLDVIETRRLLGL